MSDIRDPKAFLPLTPAMFHVMLALSDGEKHGYAILKEVSSRTTGRVELSTGTLYGIIKRLVNEGMIEEVKEGAGNRGEDARRRYYRLTRFGRRVAVAEAERLHWILSMARSKRLLEGPQPA